MLTPTDCGLRTIAFQGKGSMYLGTAVFILGVIYFMIVSPGFRVFVLVCVCGAVILIVMILINASQPPRTTAPFPATADRALVAAPAPDIKDIVLTDVVLKPSSGTKPLGQAQPSYAYWTLNGVVANNSTIPVTGLKFEVVVRDGYRIVGEGETRPNSPKGSIELCGDGSFLVPTMQARAFGTCAVHFFNMAPVARPQAWFRITAVNRSDLTGLWSMARAE